MYVNAFFIFSWHLRKYNMVDGIEGYTKSLLREQEGRKLEIALKEYV